MGFFGSRGSGAYSQLSSWSGEGVVVGVSVGDGAGRDSIIIQVTTNTGEVITGTAPAGASRAEAEAHAKAYARAVEKGLIRSRAEQSRAERRASSGGKGSFINGPYGGLD